MHLQFSTLNKLHWDLLLKQISSLCQAQESIEKTEALKPNLNQTQILERWAMVQPLKDLINIGYRPPIGAITPIATILRSAKLGQQLDGLDLRAILSLLDSVKRVYKFISDFEEKCSTLAFFRSTLMMLPNVAKEIEKAVGPDGKLLDDASPELKQIREQKRSMRKRIEDKIQSLLHNSGYEQYLQDDFFTYRSEHYVVPIKLDGRGRVSGTILDTSASGETLYLEPAEISPMNAQLRSLDLAEKLEVIRIFKFLSKLVAQNIEVLANNYDQLIELDFLSAQAEYARSIKANAIKIVDQPSLKLLEARHPLIKRDDGKPVVPNSVTFNNEAKILIISGPNAGGKTVVLETVGLLHIMAKAGLLIPAYDESEIYLFNDIFIEMGDAQNLTANLSTFSGHLHGLKRILDKATNKDLILLDEIAVGTEPTTGAAIAQAILEKIGHKNIISIITTHYDALKGLALDNAIFKNGSMEYSIKNFKPTYKLILDIPGQSYGLEVAEQLGMDKDIILRAKELKGSSASILDKAVSQLMEERDRARETQKNLENELLKVKSEKFRWEQEVEELKKSREKAASKLSEKYEDILSEMKNKYEDALKELREANKALRDQAKPTSTDVLSDQKQQVGGILSEFQTKLSNLNAETQISRELPGRPSGFKELKLGSLVYLTNMNKTGIITKLARSPKDPYEVDMAGLKMRVYLTAMRTINQGQAKIKAKVTSPTTKTPQNPKISKLEEDRVVIQSVRNTIDLRGFNKDDALDRMWLYIDQALMRGEFGVVIVHGHGTDVVKNAVRHALETQSPYDMQFRPGTENEGGDGVTVVMLGH